MNSLLLAIDIGNTHTVMGIYDNNSLRYDWRFVTPRDLDSIEFDKLINNEFKKIQLKPTQIQQTLISSVVTEVAPLFNSFCKTCLDHSPIWVDANTIEPLMPNCYDTPSDIGPDRIVNALAAFHKYKTALIIIDIGTATTFDAVSMDGTFLGGAIAPGIGISSKALFEQTSRLPDVPLADPPKNLIATTTMDSIKSGIIHGHTAMIDGMVDQMTNEMGTQVKVIATGGFSSLIKQLSTKIEIVEKSLILEGLKLVSDKLFSK